MSIADVRKFLSGRMSRKSYAVATLIYIMAYAVVIFALGDLGRRVGMVAPFIWMVGIASPRFHDFGQSGWWALLPFGLGFIQGAASGLIAAGDIPSLAIVATAGPIVVALFSLGFMIWLGLRQGDPDVNRFGPPPGQDAPEEHFT